MFFSCCEKLLKYYTNLWRTPKPECKMKRIKKWIVGITREWCFIRRNLLHLCYLPKGLMNQRCFWHKCSTTHNQVMSSWHYLQIATTFKDNSITFGDLRQLLRKDNPPEPEEHWLKSHLMPNTGHKTSRTSMCSLTNVFFLCLNSIPKSKWYFVVDSLKN